MIILLMIFSIQAKVPVFCLGLWFGKLVLIKWCCIVIRVVLGTVTILVPNFLLNFYFILFFTLIMGLGNLGYC